MSGLTFLLMESIICAPRFAAPVNSNKRWISANLAGSTFAALREGSVRAESEDPEVLLFCANKGEANSNSRRMDFIRTPMISEGTGEMLEREDDSAQACRAVITKAPVANGTFGSTQLENQRGHPTLVWRSNV